MRQTGYSAPVEPLEQRMMFSLLDSVFPVAGPLASQSHVVSNEFQTVIVWSAPRGLGVEAHSVFYRLYTNNGQVITAPLRAPSSILDNATEPAVGIAPDGRFVIAWTRVERTAEGLVDRDVLAQRFDPDGRALGSPIVVRASDHNDAFNPAVGVDEEGDFIIAYTLDRIPGDDPKVELNIFADRFNAEGERAGRVRVATRRTADESDPDLAVEPDGDFHIAFVRRRGEGADVLLRSYSDEGRLLVRRTIAGTESAEINPAVIARPEQGDVVVAWQRVREGRADRVRLRRFDLGDRRLGGVIAVDGPGCGEARPDLGVADDGRAVLSVVDELTGDASVIEDPLDPELATPLLIDLPNPVRQAQVAVAPTGQYLLTLDATSEVLGPRRVFAHRGALALDDPLNRDPFDDLL